MTRLITTVAFAFTLALIAAAIVAFVTGWWIVGIFAVLGAIVAGYFTLIGMTVIALEGFDD